MRSLALVGIRAQSGGTGDWEKNLKTPEVYSESIPRNAHGNAEARDPERVRSADEI